MFITEDGEIQTPFFRTAYNYNMDKASLLSGLLCTDETRTQQQFKEECDINTIVERFGLTGQLPESLSTPYNADFDEVIDYHTAWNKIIAADNAFMQLPAAIREDFNNDAGRWVDFVSDPKNIDKAREWGLAPALRGPQAPIEVRVIPDPSEPQKTAQEPF